VCACIAAERFLMTSQAVTVPAAKPTSQSAFPGRADLGLSRVGAAANAATADVVAVRERIFLLQFCSETIDFSICSWSF
ncbi:MAG: hypothetical protein WBD51_02915, partial [Burkholderiaceae bacterium]